MEIRIAVIGTKNMVQKVISSNNHEQVQFRSFVYDRPEASKQLIDEATNNDVLLFTGPIPYYLGKNKIEERGLLAMYVPTDELAFSVSLNYIRHHRGILPNRLSIDIPRRDIVTNILSELSINSTNIYIKEFTYSNHHFITNEMVEFHQNHWESGNIDFVLTSVQSVFDELQKKGIPSFRLIIPHKNILDTLQRAVTEGELLLSKKSQIATGIIEINGAQKEEDALDDQVWKQIQELLMTFSRKMNASLKMIDPHTFMIYGTKGGIQQITEDYRVFPFIDQLVRLHHAPIHFGFGFGLTAVEAEEHARIGLYHAKKTGEHAAFIVTEEKQVIGPLNKSVTKTFQLQSQDDQTLMIAKKTGVSVSAITKMMNFIDLRQNQIFSANDLANYLQVSKRTSERLLKKLVDNQFAEISGEEQPYHKGRPRALYKLLI
ncbi:transcriptional regulator [Brevibacillus sp. NRS-1366]|uniref:transcriptional regulator n=1 Tax=Brevibacillus sp. NRS-1366 TaxID=3233899 RepID=UPI003D204F93